MKREPASEDSLRAHTVGELKPLAEAIVVVDYDPQWPSQFEREASRIRTALGERASLIEHVGSTSVPTLPAKPIIDILLVVRDSSKEAEYVDALQEAGYSLRIREPEWFEHRMLRSTDTAVHLHVFSEGCPEIARMLAFRNWLRSNPDDRELYARTKSELAKRDWKYMQHYADAKTAVVEEILARAYRPEPG